MLSVDIELRSVKLKNSTTFQWFMHVLGSCLVPMWFHTTDLFIQLLFALVTLLIAFYSFRVYKITKTRYPFLFGFGFLAVSLAYLTQLFLDLLIRLQISSNDIISRVIGLEAAQTTFQLSALATISYIVLMVSGLGLLSYVTLKERGTKPLLLILSLSFVALLLAANYTVAFYLITSIFLLFMSAQYYQRHEKSRSIQSLYIFFGFALLFLGNILLALASIMISMYIIGHLLSLVGYIFLLASLLRVVK